MIDRLVRVGKYGEVTTMTRGDGSISTIGKGTLVVASCVLPTNAKKGDRAALRGALALRAIEAIRAAGFFPGEISAIEQSAYDGQGERHMLDVQIFAESALSDAPDVRSQ